MTVTAVIPSCENSFPLSPSPEEAQKLLATGGFAHVIQGETYLKCIASSFLLSPLLSYSSSPFLYPPAWRRVTFSPSLFLETPLSPYS